MCEDAKVAIRNARHDGLDMAKDSELSEDEEKHLEGEIQNIINEFNKKVEDELAVKESDLMSV